MLGGWFRKSVNRELQEARDEKEEARRELLKKLRRSQEEGVTVQLSRAALERIVKIEAAG